MPFCQKCKKQDLKRTEVELDQEHNLVVCRPCFHELNPGQPLPSMPQVGPMIGSSPLLYDVQLRSDEGLSVRAQYGSVSFEVAATPVQLITLGRKITKALP